MLKPLRARYVLTAVLMVGAVSPALTEAAAPDSTLVTTYDVSTDLTEANFSVCGSVGQSEGCYGGGHLGPFGHIGAMLEGQPVVNGSTVTRDIYVLDVASGSNANGVTLFVYTKTDVVSVSASDDQVTVALAQTIALPLPGGSTVAASMAANGSFLFASTNQSTSVARITKGQWSVTSFGGFSPPLNVFSLSADANGFVSATFGTPGGQGSAFIVFDSAGGFNEDGGGPDFVLNSLNAVVPAPLPF